MEWFNELRDEIISMLHTNPEKFFIIVGIAGTAVLLIAILIVLMVVAAKRKRSKDADQVLIEETLKEQEEQVVAEEESEEVPVVEESSDEEVVVEETPVIEEPVDEETETAIETEPAVEEKKPVKKTKKKSTKKSTKKAKKPAKEKVEETPVDEDESVIVEEETPVVEEQPVEVIEEPVVEEVPAEENTPEVNEEASAVEAPVSKRKKKTKEEAEKALEEVEASLNEEVEEAPVEEKKPRAVYGKYEVYTDGTSYYYTLKASNGEVLIKSEAYASKDSVLLAIEAIKRNVEVGTISVRQDKHGLYQFVLTARNHRTLVMSANYKTEKRAQSASESFKRFASNSPIVELTEIVESNKEEVVLEDIVDKKGGKLVVVSSENGYYYMLKASNGEVLVTSDNYKTETSVQNALARFQEAVVNGKFYVVKDKRDNYQFKLFAANGRIVCVGQIYASKALAIASVNSVCSFVKLATVVNE